MDENLQYSIYLFISRYLTIDSLSNCVKQNSIKTHCSQIIGFCAILSLLWYIKS